MTESDRRRFVELLNECGCAASERALATFAGVRVNEHTDAKAAAVALLTWIEGYAERAVAAHVSGVPVPPAAGPIWPIARLFIDSAGNVCGDSRLYAPGLPEGMHDVYPLPVNADAVPVASGVQEVPRG